VAKYLDIIEAAYATHLTDEAWLGNLTEVTFRTVEGAVGAMQAAYFPANDGQPAMRIGCSVGQTPTSQQVDEWAGAKTTPADLRRLLSPIPPADLLTRRAQRIGRPALAASVAPLLHPLADDVVALNGGDGASGAVVAVLLRRENLPSPRAMSLLDRVAVHFGAAQRMRSLVRPQRVEAVLDPGGKVLHAEDAAKPAHAREALSLAVLAMERARGKLRRLAPEEAVDLWRGLVSGRWTIIDHVDGDGRRTLLARRNDLARRDPSMLTDLELQVAGFAALGYPNKLVAYATGLGLSTTATHLSHAMRKLHARSRNELQRLLDPWLATGARPRL
jgi:DNA-binding CsgD family transcriptional regulator